MEEILEINDEEEKEKKIVQKFYKRKVCLENNLAKLEKKIRKDVFFLFLLQFNKI